MPSERTGLDLTEAIEAGCAAGGEAWFETDEGGEIGAHVVSAAAVRAAAPIIVQAAREQVAAELWKVADGWRAGYVTGDRGIEYINGFEDAANRVEHMAKRSPE